MIPDLNELRRRLRNRNIYRNNTGGLGEPRIVHAHKAEAEADLRSLIDYTERLEREASLTAIHLELHCAGGCEAWEDALNETEKGDVTDDSR